MTSPNNDLVERFGLGSDWDATSHAAFLRAAGGGTAGYTADLIEALYSALTLQSEQIAALQAERERLREALKPSGATKAAYIGEFSFTIEEWDCDGGEDGEGAVSSRTVYVPWDTIKQIMAAIYDRAALLQQEETGK